MHPPEGGCLPWNPIISDGIASRKQQERQRKAVQISYCLTHWSCHQSARTCFPCPLGIYKNLFGHSWSLFFIHFSINWWWLASYASKNNTTSKLENTNPHLATCPIPTELNHHQSKMRQCYLQGQAKSILKWNHQGDLKPYLAGHVSG